MQNLNSENITLLTTHYSPHLIDTHAHLYAEQFDTDRHEMIQKAINQGVTKIFMPNIDDSSIKGMLELEAKYPETCLAMMGLHPCSVGKDVVSQLKIVEDWLNTRKFVAVGEIGLDFYWSLEFVKEQENAFTIQVNWAKERNLPIVIHCRESMDRTIELLTPLIENGNPNGIFHCFTGTLEQAQRIVDLGFLLGIGGVATFKNGGLDKVLPYIGLENLVLETDSPYLAPVPHRGKRNEPTYLPLVAARISDLKGIDYQTVAEKTTENAARLFNIMSV